MESPLSFNNTESFRKSLNKFNLEPYNKVPSKYDSNINYEYIQSNYPVVDSPDELIDNPTIANELYKLNQYGNEGGYEQVADPNTLKNTKTNEGEYDKVGDANIIEQGLSESKNWKKVNLYSTGDDGVVDGAEFIDTLDLLPSINNINNNQPYYQFINSFYSPLDILLSNDPQGSEGLLSQDSFIAQLGATNLRRDFENRIALQIERQTIGRVNALNVDGLSDVLSLASGRVPLIEPNWSITIPANPITEVSDFTLRLGGGYVPTSLIPGSYWDTNINTGNPTTLQQLKGAFNNTSVGKFFNKLVGGDRTGSQIFFNNTGEGQKSRLFYNIDYNKYKPSFERNRGVSLLGSFIDGLFDNSDYYIGSSKSDPSRILSPSGDLPVNEFGGQDEIQVYGPSEIAKEYEDNSEIIKIGANGKAYTNSAGIEGGLTWVSPKYKDNAGKKVGVGGRVLEEDEDFNSATFTSSESTNFDFKDGSILDKTQRIVDSQPNGAKRFKHVGNAIDQVSKVFNDGYKEITKGSKVLKYIGEAGQEVATEYCRVFTKDTPYLQYNDLQKINGMTSEGRKFSHSVLDKTFNLNISPNKQEGGQDSTNLIGNSQTGHVKKYMFSLENLAWRTSSRSGLSVSDLPLCERGPNNGRVMWFPPYDLNFSETISASWKSTDFLGRPEPVFTYTNTKRSGQLSWSMVVDHPSVLNVVVNKVLSKETNRDRVDSILESFFAGCRTYDLYELAKKYYTVNPNDLFEIQKRINEKTESKNVIEYLVKEVQSGGDSTNNKNQQFIEDVNYLIDDLNDTYQNVGLYFDNAVPRPGDENNSYDDEYNSYSSRVNGGIYSTKNTSGQTSSFFSNVITPNYNQIKNLASDINYIFSNEGVDGSITIDVDTSASAPGSENYNDLLSERRFEMFKNFFSENQLTKNLISEGKLIIIKGNIVGERTYAQKYDDSGNKIIFETINCSDTWNGNNGGDTVGANEIYTINAMACRSALIYEISGNLTKTVEVINEPTEVNTEITYEQKIGTETTTTTEEVTETIPRNNITKRVLRSLLTECEYFETIKEDSPMVYDNLKDKLKYFQPIFHSTTPEGLNSRLTFLQQCLRPGDTIPTVKDFNGTTELQYDNAINTAFGSPPVLVLRIGDFFNTKIIPNTMSIQYENLDINPEGIGVQPVIAKVTLGFDFIGGSGLKESISKLQNALSFNYYANTEMYDDRSDSTDLKIAGKDIKVFDEEFLKSIGQNVPPPKVNQTQNNNGQTNNTTIGDILTKTTSGTTEQGTISYTKLMDNLVQTSQNYFLTILNKNKEVVSQYNNAVRQQWMLNRNYTRGNLKVDSGNELIIFGKPYNVQQRIDEIFDNFISNITDDSDKFITEFNSYDFSPKLKKVVKENYINYIKEKKTTFINSLSVITQELLAEQQKLINYFGKVNTITYDAEPYTGTDGYQNSKGNVITYLLSGDTEDTWDELVEDVLKIKDDYNNYNETTQQNSISFSKGKKSYTGEYIIEVNYDGSQTNSDPTVENVFLPFSDGILQIDYTFRREYMILSNDIIDSNNYDSFKQRLIGNVINNKTIIGTGESDVEKIFDKYWINFARPRFIEENELTTYFLEYVENNKLQDYINYTPFSTKERIFNFTSDYSVSQTYKDDQETLIRGLNLSKPIGTNKTTWNDLLSNSNNDAYVSKPKLN